MTPGRSTLLLWAVFAAIAFALYGPALHGPFLSDDYVYIGAANPWTSQLSAENVLAVLDPTGDARFHQANYAPVHLLATAVEWQLFGDDPLGYHVVNILMHAGNAALLAWLLLACGIGFPAASLGALFFLVHPANVEAVAWASQLKTNGSLALSLGALLVLRRHPGAATLLFGLALLTKASASLALPFAAALTWTRWGRDDGDSTTGSRWPWLALWALLLSLYSVPQVTAFHPHGGVSVPAYEDGLVHLRTIASIGLRYLVMAATSLGVSHTQEHPPVLDPFDPRWLAALAVGGLLLWRVIATLRRRDVEGAWWIAAAAGFAPVSQISPFSHPIADRYLYFILPGLIGGTLFALRDARGRASRIAALPPALLGRIAVAGALALAVFFGAKTSLRSRLWTDQLLLSLDSAWHNPAGRTAAYLEAQQAAKRGDAGTAVAALRRAATLGRDRFDALDADPMLAPIRNDPGFRALVDELADVYIAGMLSRGRPLSQEEHAALFVAYYRRGRLDLAERSLEAALARGGPYDERIERDLVALRELRAEADRDGGGGLGPWLGSQRRSTR